MSATERRCRLTVPDGWGRMEQFCEPGRDSKAYKSDETGANVHVVNMYDTGAWVVNGEDADGETFDDRYYDYFDALAHARGWMLRHD